MNGSEKSSNGECRPLIIVASTTVKDLFSKVDAHSPSPRPFHLPSSTFAFPLRISPSGPLWPPLAPSGPLRQRRPGLSLLQIGLVVLRVHQDNSLVGFVFLPRERCPRGLEVERFGERERETEGGRKREGRGKDPAREGTGNILYACFMFCPFRDLRAEELSFPGFWALSLLGQV